MEIIHIVLGKANPDRLNGVNKVVYNLATEQTKAGKKVQVWGISSDTHHNYPERNFTTVLFQAQVPSYRVNRALKAAIVEHKNAVFHLHGGWIPLFSGLARLFARHRVTFVLTPHGAYNTVAMQRSFWKKKLYFYLFEKTLLQRAHKIHAIGNSEVTGLNGWFPNRKSVLLPYGFDGTPETTIGAKNAAFTVGFVGRLDIHTKGLDLLVEAFARFQRTHPDAQLWIVGDGPGKTQMEQFILEKNVRHVTLWGKKFGREKDELMAQMHVFAHPSRNEGLPTAVLEAAAMGVPTIVTQATNIAEYIKQFGAGVAIPDNHVVELEMALRLVYAKYLKNEAHTYTEGSRQMLKEVFAWPTLVHQYDQLYQ